MLSFAPPHTAHQPHDAHGERLLAEPHAALGLAVGEPPAQQHRRQHADAVDVDLHRPEGDQDWTQTDLSLTPSRPP